MAEAPTSQIVDLFDALKGALAPSAPPLPTRALSLIQPWAWAVVHGPKDVENRVWWTSMRGPFWIAASAQVTRRYYDQAREIIEARAPGLRVPSIDDLHYGCIIGSASIVDCILPGGFAAKSDRDGQFAKTRLIAGTARSCTAVHPLHPHRWHFPEQYGYVLADRKPLATPVACKGHQRWWTVPADVIEWLRGVA